MYNPQQASPPPNQSSPIPAFNLDDDNFEPLWAFASQPSQNTEGPSEPVEDDSPVEEVAPVKPKRKYTRRRQPIKKSDKEFVEPWTIEDEVALCKAWVSASENSIEGNGKKASGVWTKVTEGCRGSRVCTNGLDKAKKKASSSSVARSESSIAGDPSLVVALFSKFTMAAKPFFSQRKESSSEYLRIKERELKLED
uniref:Uncharacterized protein n=1 Tax=Tanacetum cinerariifolium TaxID=118510 RepID=A0A6L2JSS3_TANCI|nr:hypothetical protein [Tanacetum cinerariifolium]